jgi:hypothetical protein
LDTELPQWELCTEPLPFAARGHHTAIVVGTDLWVIGGSNQDSVLSDVAVLNLETLQWTLPQLRYGSPRVQLLERVYRHRCAGVHF